MAFLWLVLVQCTLGRIALHQDFSLLAAAFAAADLIALISFHPRLLLQAFCLCKPHPYTITQLRHLLLKDTSLQALLFTFAKARNRVYQISIYCLKE